MPFRSWSEVIDEKYPPGTQERRRFDYYDRRLGQVGLVTGFVYRALYRIPPRWVTLRDDEYGTHNYVGVGPVAAQFWSDILSGILERFAGLDDERGARSIFYGALDGLSWRFFDDEYVPTWADVKRGKSGRTRLIWRLRRKYAIEQAEAIASDYFAGRDGMLTDDATMP